MMYFQAKAVFATLVFIYILLVTLNDYKEKKFDEKIVLLRLIWMAIMMK